MPNLVILDVGHGNCAVITDSEGTVIIDVPLGDTLLRFLKEQGIRVIDTVLVSHADSDHIAGLPSLLLQQEIELKKVYLNSEARRETAIFRDLQHALGEARRSFNTKIHVELTTENSKDLVRSEMSLDILAPVPEIALRGAGEKDLKGRKLTANSMSVVIRLRIGDLSAALFTGDLDSVGLDNLLDEVSNPVAQLLVFPHHGGLPGRAKAFEFAQRICEAVKPQILILSIGRGMHGTPRPEIVAGIRKSVPGAWIACTQLSERCAAELPSSEPTHLGSLPARGKSARACCAGTVEFNWSKGAQLQIPSVREHQAFVKTQVRTALCQK